MGVRIEAGGGREAVKELDEVRLVSGGGGPNRAFGRTDLGGITAEGTRCLSLSNSSGTMDGGGEADGGSGGDGDGDAGAECARSEGAGTGEVEGGTSVGWGEEEDKFDCFCWCQLTVFSELKRFGCD